MRFAPLIRFLCVATLAFFISAGGCNKGGGKGKGKGKGGGGGAGAGDKNNGKDDKGGRDGASDGAPGLPVEDAPPGSGEAPGLGADGSPVPITSPSFFDGTDRLRAPELTQTAAAAASLTAPPLAAPLPRDLPPPDTTPTLTPTPGSPTPTSATGPSPTRTPTRTGDPPVDDHV